MKLQTILILILLTLSGCRANSSSANDTAQTHSGLTISAAVSLKDAFNEIGALYKTKTGKAIDFNYGASGALQQQIETGAPVDIFASAGERQMDELASKNLVEPTTRRDFVRNKLVLIVPADSKTTLTQFSDLTEPDIQKIAVGNPKTVPAGQYTEQVFEKTNLKDKLQSKLIFAEDVRQVLDYVARGETDAGIVYASDAQTAGQKVRVIATAADDAHDPILYPIAILKNDSQPASAQDFLNLVLSTEGQTILRKYGFVSISDK